MKETSPYQDLKDALIDPAIFIASSGSTATGYGISLIDIVPGKTIHFGQYDWRVLDVQGEEILVLSENVLEGRAFHSTNSYNTEDVVRITWEECTLRKYLNGEFYNSFSAEEQERIVPKQIITNNNPWNGTWGGNATHDKIFLLSIEEVVRYFGDSYDLQNRVRWNWGYWDENARTYQLSRCEGDAGIFLHDKYNSIRRANKGWWLRSLCYYPSSEENTSNITRAAGVIKEGIINVSFGQDVTDGRDQNRDSYNGVRPALWLKLKNLDTARNIKRLLEAVEHGDADAQYKIGIMYKNGHNVPQNSAKARELFIKAAEQGHEEAKKYFAEEADEFLAQYSEVKAKIPLIQTAYEYDVLAREFENIGQALQTLPASFGLQAQIDECYTYRRQCLDKKHQDETISQLNTAKAKMPTMKTSYDYSALTKEFDNIGQTLQSLSSLPAFEVQAHIEECETLRKQCIEKENQCKRDETIFQLNTAKAELRTIKNVDEYKFISLASRFESIGQVLKSLPSSFVVQAQIDECEILSKKCKEKSEIKQRREKRKETSKYILPSVGIGIIAGGGTFGLTYATYLGGIVICAVFGLIISIITFTSRILGIIIGVIIGVILTFIFAYMIDAGWIIGGIILSSTIGGIAGGIIGSKFIDTDY